MTRAELINVINSMSDEQFNAVVIVMQEKKFIYENTEELELQKPKKVLRAKGIFNECANPEMIPFEREAYINAVVERYVEKYEKNKNS